MISGALVIASGIPYVFRTYQKKVRPNITSWSLWAVIGLVLLLTYKASGAEDNVWPAVFGFTNPTIITAVAIWRRAERKRMTVWEIFSAVGCVLSLTVWWGVREEQELAQYALYLAILADLFAAIPTIIFVWTEPAEDRPGAWMMYAFAYGMAVFAVSTPTFANYALPIYMFFGALSTALPLTLYRIKKKIPIKEWT